MGYERLPDVVRRAFPVPRKLPARGAVFHCPDELNPSYHLADAGGIDRAIHGLVLFAPEGESGADKRIFVSGTIFQHPIRLAHFG